MGIKEKEKRRAALQQAKRRRNGEHSSSALDSYDPTAANDVQDFLGKEEEEVYRARVEANRQKEDFVVDDGTFCVYSVCL
jgi:hypothetical protein